MNDILAFSRPPYEPNTDILRTRGWSIISTNGPYCTAWKGSQEILLIWRNGFWERVACPGDQLFTPEALAS